MATAWQLTGTNQIVATLRANTGAAENVSFDVNDKQAYSILGGYVNVLAGGVGHTLDIEIGGVSILKAAVSAAAAGQFALDLTATAANLQGTAGENVTLTTSNTAVQAIVTLFISQAAPATLA